MSNQSIRKTSIGGRRASNASASFGLNTPESSDSQWATQRSSTASRRLSMLSLASGTGASPGALPENNHGHGHQQQQHKQHQQHQQQKQQQQPVELDAVEGTSNLEALLDMPGIDNEMMQRFAKALESNTTNHPDREAVIQVLRHLRFFRGMPSALIERCAETCYILKTQATRKQGGSMLMFQQGTPVTRRAGIFVLLSGKVDLYEIAGTAGEGAGGGDDGNEPSQSRTNLLRGMRILEEETRPIQMPDTPGELLSTDGAPDAMQEARSSGLLARRHKGGATLDHVNVISTSPTSSSHPTAGGGSPSTGQGGIIAYKAGGTPAMMGVGKQAVKRQDSIGQRVLLDLLTRDDMLRVSPKNASKKELVGGSASSSAGGIILLDNVQPGSFESARSPPGFATTPKSPSYSSMGSGGSSGRLTLRELAPLSREVLLAGAGSKKSRRASLMSHSEASANGSEVEVESPGSDTNSPATGTYVALSSSGGEEHVHNSRAPMGRQRTSSHNQTKGGGHKAVFDVDAEVWDEAIQRTPSTKSNEGTKSPGWFASRRGHAKGAQPSTAGNQGKLNQTDPGAAGGAAQTSALGEVKTSLRPGDAFGEDTLIHSVKTRWCSANMVGAGPNSPGIAICLDADDVLDGIHGYVAGKLSPTYHIRPTWCRSAMTASPSKRSKGDVVRFLHCLDGVRAFEWLRDPKVVDEIMATAHLTTAGPGDAVHAEGMPAIEVKILVSGSVALRKLAAIAPQEMPLVGSPTFESRQGQGRDESGDLGYDDQRKWGDVVGTIVAGDLVLAPAPWDLGVWPCSAIAGSDGCEMLSIPCSTYRKIAKSRNCRLNGRQYAELLFKEERSELENGRLAAYLSRDLLEGVPLDRRVHVASHLRGARVKAGTSLGSARPDCQRDVCVLVTGLMHDPSAESSSVLARSLKEGGLGGSGVMHERLGGVERFLGEDDVVHAPAKRKEGAYEDVGYQGKGWFAEYASCSSVLGELQAGGGLGWEGGVLSTDRCCMLEGIFATLSLDASQLGDDNQLPDLDTRHDTILPSSIIGGKNAPWLASRPGDAAAAKNHWDTAEGGGGPLAYFDSVVAAVKGTRVLELGLERGSYRVRKHERVIQALQEAPETRRTDDLNSIAAAASIGLLRQLPRSMMHELTRGATLVSLPPHSSLCDEGGPLPGLCVVLQGTVFASRVTESRVKRGKASSRQMVISGPARLHAAGGVSARRILEGVVAGMADEECVAAYSNGDSFGHSIATHASAVSRATVFSRAESAEIMCIPARNFEQFSDLIRSQSELDMRLLASMASSLTVPAHLRLDEEVFCISRMLSSLASLQGKGMDVLLRIAKRAYRRKLVAGEVLDVEGDEIGRFNLVVSGRIEAWKGLTRGARTLYDIRDGSLFPDMISGSVQSGLPFHVDWEAFRSGWDHASSGGSKEGIMMELNTSVLAGHVDRWIRKLYKLDQEGDLMAFVHPASVAGVLSGKEAVAASAIRGMKSPLRRGSSTFGSGSLFALDSSVDLTGSASRGGVKYRTVGNIGASVVRCEPLQGHARSTPAVVAACGGAATGGDDSISGAGSSRTMPDGASPVCVISWGSGAGDDHVLCCEDAKDAAAWLGAMSWHLCRGRKTPLGQRKRLIEAGEMFGAAMLAASGRGGLQSSNTYVASEPSEILAIDRADFEAALAEGRESETKEIQQTLVKVFGLGSLGLSSELLDKVCSSIRPSRFKRGDNMFTAGAKAKDVILLTSGSCCLQRVVHHSTKVSTSDGSTPILSRAHAPRKQNAVVANLHAPSVVGLPLRKDGTTGADVHVLGAVALTQADGLVLSLGEMEEVETLKKVYAHLEAMASRQESSISGNSGAFEKTFWHKGAQTAADDEETAGSPNGHVLAPSAISSPTAEGEDGEDGNERRHAYESKGEGGHVNAVALLGEKYRTAAQDMRRIPNKNAMCIRCQAHFDDHLNRCDQCGKFVRGGTLEEFLEMQAEAAGRKYKRNERDKTKKLPYSRRWVPSEGREMMTTAIVRSGPNTPERSPPRTPGTPTMNRTLSAESRRGVSTPGSARVRSGGSRERPGSKGRPGSRSAESQGRPGSRSAESQGRPGSSGGERVPNDGRVGSGGGRRGSSGRGSDYGHQQRQESAGGGAGRIGTFQPPDVFVLDEEEEPDEAGDEVLSPYVSQYEREYSMTGYLPERLPSEIERLPSELDISLMHRLPSLDAVGSSSVKVSVKGEHVGSRRSSQVAQGQDDGNSPRAKVDLRQTLERTTNRHTDRLLTARFRSPGPRHALCNSPLSTSSEKPFPIRESALDSSWEVVPPKTPPPLPAVSPYKVEPYRPVPSESSPAKKKGKSVPLSKVFGYVPRGLRGPSRVDVRSAEAKDILKSLVPDTSTAMFRGGPMGGAVAVSHRGGKIARTVSPIAIREPRPGAEMH